MEIGSKIKDARIKSGMTQEVAAESLGVSRQTISNWENDKTWPDIISVINMSDLYSVSLDVLLKENNSMSEYVNYLDESTNVVKSKNNQSKLILVLAGLVIWAVAMLIYWLFMNSSDAMGYSLMFLWIILPVTILVLSIIIGVKNFWLNKKWIAPVIFGLMYMLAEYGTFSLSNMMAFDKFNMPEFSMLGIGIIISLLGLLIGSSTRWIGEKKNH